MKTAAVILAGGMSRRMGRDKAALPFGEETMLSRLIRIYRPYFDLTAVSVNSAGRFDTCGALEVVDRHPGDGPMAGLEAAFLDTGADLIFLTATDLPFGDPALAQYLIKARGDHDVCLIRSDKGWNLCSRSIPPPASAWCANLSRRGAARCLMYSDRWIPWN